MGHAAHTFTRRTSVCGGVGSEGLGVGVGGGQGEQRLTPTTRRRRRILYLLLGIGRPLGGRAEARRREDGRLSPFLWRPSSYPRKPRGWGWGWGVEERILTPMTRRRRRILYLLLGIGRHLGGRAEARRREDGRLSPLLC